MTSNNPKGLTGENVSEEQAQEIAKKFIGEEKVQEINLSSKSENTQIITYDFNVKVKPVKQDVIDKLKELIDKSVVAPNNTEIMILIQEDIQAYFDGSKSLDDTIKIVQDKVSKYVNENR